MSHNENIDKKLFFICVNIIYFGFLICTGV